MRHADTWGKKTSPYHDAEREIHRRYGIFEEQSEMTRSVYSQALTDYHQQFLASLPYVVIGSIDESGQPWASLLSGGAGFLRPSQTGAALTIDALPTRGDRLHGRLQPGRAASIVGIDLSARRRIRMNGTIGSVTDAGFVIDVAQAYNNCPQYIQRREAQPRDGRNPAAPPVHFDAALPDRVVEIITTADTFFVASNNPRDDQADVGGTDVNHRGGPPGFVRLESGAITIPDYAGNFAFNTLGNFRVDPRAGLLFIDFEFADVVQIAGRVEIIWDGPEVERFPAAQRAWRVLVDEGTMIEGASAQRWTFVDYSRHAAIIPPWSTTPR